MEVFVDFGLFEVLAITGLAALGRAAYKRPVTRWLLVVISIAAPAAILFLATTELVRWLAAVAVACSLISTSMIVNVVLRGSSRGAPAARDPKVDPSIGSESPRAQSTDDSSTRTA